jgi:integrase
MEKDDALSHDNHACAHVHGLAARTIAAAHRFLGKVLSDAEKDALVARNVCKIQRAPKVQAQEMAIVKDVPGLIDKLQGSRLYSLAIIALFTGMRLGEILALRWQHLDLDRGVAKVREALEETKAHGVRFKPTKTTAGRRDITLPTIVTETLREHRRELMETRLRLGIRDDIGRRFRFLARSRQCAPRA